jgi:LacI family transcriptional regulator
MSLRKLASSLGLSVATVSRALDGYPDVAESTRARVVAAAKAANYRPNAAARRLSKGKTEVVSLVLPTESGHFNEPLYMQLMQGLGQGLARAGYDLALHAAAPGPEEAALYRRIVESRRADALIVVRTRREDPRVDYLQEVGFPFICMGRTDAAKPYAYLDADGVGAFRQATERLIALGHTRIAHLAAPSAFSFAQHRRAGYVEAMRAAGLEPIVVEAAADEEHGRDASARLIAGARPTAIAAATDRMAYGALKAARDAGLKVGHDLSLIGYDNLTASAYTDPPLTTMQLPIDAAAHRLAEMALARIDGAEPGDLQEIRAVETVERETVGPPA